MSEYVTKDTFEAHILRLEERASSMEDRLSRKIDRLGDAIFDLKTESEKREGRMEALFADIKRDNNTTRWTILVLTATILAAILASIAPIGAALWKQFLGG